MRESTELFLERNFDTAMKIHAICYDKNISRQKSKLFTYMFVKMQDSGLGLDYFDADHAAEIEALMLLLGMNSRPQDALVFDEQPTLEDMPKIVGELACRAIKQAEKVAQQRYGIESPITPELMLRLKFHIDADFRKKMVDEMVSLVASELGQYTKENVQDSITREQAHLRAQDDLLKNLFA